MKKKSRIIKLIISLLLIVVNLIFIALDSYVLILYKGVETFYRFYGIIILIYFFFFTSYLLLRGVGKKKIVKLIIPIVITLIIICVEALLFNYLYKIYKAIDSYSKDENVYYTSLVTYDLNLNNEKDLNNKKIGIVNDTSDIEGYIIPNEVISELSLKNSNTIKEYNSTLELLYALKNKEIDCAFFSSNYIDMFSSMDDFENIEEETKVIYETSKEYVSDSEEEETTSTLTEPFTMLLIGVDSSKDGVTSGYNADVLLLVSFNPKTLRATLTSVPRDMYLKTACSNGQYRRINTTTWGSSSSCAVSTIEQLFDVDIDYYAKINFKGVVKLVDDVGGIDVNVPYSICDQNSSRKWGSNTVFVEKGMQHLNGEQALAFARNRHKPNDGSKAGKNMAKYCPTYTSGKRNDYTRGKNQMKVIMGVLQAATKLTNPDQAVDILNDISSNFQTNLKTKDILSFYNLGKSILITGSSNLVNVQRLQLSGKDAWGTVYDTASKSYPAVTLPYVDSVNDIKKEINNNLKNNYTVVKKISFDLNDPYEQPLIGSGSYSSVYVTTLKDMSSMTVSAIKSYASSIGKSVKFVDKSTNEEVSIYDYSNYYFYSQKEHKDTITDQISSITIYVKQRTITPQISTDEDDNNNSEETTTE